MGRKKSSSSAVAKTYTLIEAIEEVANHYIKKEENDIADVLKTLETRLDVDQTKAILFSICVANFASVCTSLNEMARYIGVSDLKMLQFRCHLDELVSRRLLIKVGMDGMPSYRVPTNVIDSISLDMVFKHEIDVCITDLEMLVKMNEYIENAQRKNINNEQLQEDLDNIIEMNKDLSIVDKIRKKHLGHDTELLLWYFCARHSAQQDDCIGTDDLKVLFGNDYSFVSTLDALQRGHSTLLRLGLIEKVKGNNDMPFNAPGCYRLTPKAKSDILSEPALKNYNGGGNGSLKCHTFIVEKPLFFNDDVKTQVDELKSLLSPYKYKRVRTRMMKAGMRTGFAALFYGAPGTGKTETVLQIAKATGRDIMQIDISQLRDKYVGESEKAVSRLFDDYRKASREAERYGKEQPILLFNEADGIFGIRRNGADTSVDKMENAIQNIILQEMEQLDGILIATTNLTENLDKAFERRFLYKVKFEKPDKETRAQIMSTMLPDLDKEIVKAACDKYELSGGQLENISRKLAIESVLHGPRSKKHKVTVEKMLDLCKQESLSQDQPERKRVGF